MTFKSLAARAGIAAVTLTALGAAAATPAAAHTNNMYTYVYPTEAQNGYVTYSKTDGTTAFLSPTSPDRNEFQIVGIEVANEKGVELFGTEEGWRVGLWDHSTGEIQPPVDVTLPGADLLQVIGLDTLNDGRTVTLVSFEINFGEDSEVFWAVAELSPTTGVLTPLVDVSSVMGDGPEIYFYFTSLATDPLSGITYVFLRQDDTSAVYFLPVNVAGNSAGTVTQFTGTGFAEGHIDGSDFDADGTLYFNYEDATAESDSFSLSKLGAPSTWPTAARTQISLAPAEADREIFELALTIEHTALADTGSELPLAAWMLVGTVAVVAGGVTVMVARRRSEAGTV